MRLTTELVQPIVDHLMSRMSYNINIMNKQGVIIASGDPARLHQVHEGALLALRMKEEVIITREESRGLSGSRPGINLIIEFHGEIIGVVGVTGESDHLQEMARVIKMSVEVLLDQIYLNQQIQQQMRVIENWLLDLANPDARQFDPHRLEVIARSLNIGVRLPRAAFVIHMDDAEGELAAGHSQVQIPLLHDRRERVSNMLRAVLDQHAVFACIRETLFMALVPLAGDGPAEEKRIAAKLHAHLADMQVQHSISIGRRHSDLCGYRKSCLQALSSHELRKRLCSSSAINHIDDWGIIAAYSSIPEQEREDLLERYWPEGQLLSADLEESLLVFLDCNLHVKQAAKRLHIHHNTLMYRLEKICDQLGMDPRDFKDATLLQMLLISRKLQEK